MLNLAERISDSELEIMRVLWEAGSAMTINEIKAVLLQSSTWEDSTIRTLIRRLHQKEVLTQEKRGVFYYSPRVSEVEYNEYSTRKLIDKLYNGSPKALIAALATNESFTEEEIEELRSMFIGGMKHE